MRWTLPNILTVLRLLAAPGVAVMFLYFARPWADWFALVLFALAAATDWFDGYLARAWKQESKFGAMLDPIADKAMVVIALLVICGFSLLLHSFLFSFGKTVSERLWLDLCVCLCLCALGFSSGLRALPTRRNSRKSRTRFCKY